MCCEGLCDVGGREGEGGGGQSSHHDVAAAVQGQVVGPGEGAVALGAAERFDPRVLAEMSSQLVGAGEAPGAALPGTVVGLLTCRGEETRRGVRRQDGMGGSRRKRNAGILKLMLCSTTFPRIPQSAQ